MRYLIPAALILAVLLWPSAPVPSAAAPTATSTPTLDQLHPVTPRPWPWPSTATPDVPIGGATPLPVAHTIYLPIVAR